MTGFFTRCVVLTIGVIIFGFGVEFNVTGQDHDTLFLFIGIVLLMANNEIGRA